MNVSDASTLSLLSLRCAIATQKMNFFHWKACFIAGLR